MTAEERAAERVRKQAEKAAAKERKQADKIAAKVRGGGGAGRILLLPPCAKWFMGSVWRQPGGGRIPACD
jgi:hypothetical protein